MNVRSRNFTFTCNNYSDEDQEYLASLDYKYIVFGREVGDSGTPHLQGHISFGEAKSLGNLVKLLEGCHVEACRNVAASIRYCKKDGDYSEYGCMGSGQGTRSDLIAAVEEAKQGLSLRELRTSYPTVMCRYSKFIEEVRSDYLRPVLPNIELNQWQLSLDAVLRGESPDRRTIHLVIDPVGGAGKSTFCCWLVNSLPGVQLFGSGKGADIAYACQEPLIALFDFARSQDEYRPWGMVEQIKNGVVFSTKYNSQTKFFPPPHVVVFTNSDVEPGKLSEDRLNRVWLSHSVESASSSSWINK